MINNFEELYDKLRNGLFLSSMMRITDGAFCSERGGGCAMVQLGAYLAEPPAYGEQEYFLPPTQVECTGFFVDECQRVKDRFKTFTCLNLATPKLEWGLEAAECFRRAGGDFVELNVHGSYRPYLRLGKLRAMVLPENRDELYRWVKGFIKLEIPLIVKFRQGVIEDYSLVLNKIIDFEPFGIHFNVRNQETKKPDFKFVRALKRKYSFFLLVSGYVRSVNDVRRLSEAGADMIGIAEPTKNDPRYIERISNRLKKD